MGVLPDLEMEYSEIYNKVSHNTQKSCLYNTFFFRTETSVFVAFCVGVSV